MKRIESRLNQLEKALGGETEFFTFKIPHSCLEEDRQYLLRKRFNGQGPPDNAIIAFIKIYSNEFAEAFYKEKSLYMSREAA